MHMREILRENDIIGQLADNNHKFELSENVVKKLRVHITCIIHTKFFSVCHRYFCLSN